MGRSTRTCSQIGRCGGSKIIAPKRCFGRETWLGDIQTTNQLLDGQHVSGGRPMCEYVRVYPRTYMYVYERRERERNLQVGEYHSHDPLITMIPNCQPCGCFKGEIVEKIDVESDAVFHFRSFFSWNQNQIHMERKKKFYLVFLKCIDIVCTYYWCSRSCSNGLTYECVKLVLRGKSTLLIDLDVTL